MPTIYCIQLFLFFNEASLTIIPGIRANAKKFPKNPLTLAGEIKPFNMSEITFPRPAPMAPGIPKRIPSTGVIAAPGRKLIHPNRIGPVIIAAPAFNAADIAIIVMTEASQRI